MVTRFLEMLGPAGAADGGSEALPSARPGPRSAALALGALTLVAATSQGCACGSEGWPSGCGTDCATECKPALPLGMPGSYTSLAKAPDGTLWVAGYNDALIAEGDSQLWGDLVVGPYDADRQRVAWKTVDGLPTREPGTCADRAADSWRGGETDSGDDVGLFTSIQIGADGRPMVSYYDATNKRLKYAFQTEDGGWRSIALREQPLADIGRYARMLLVGNKPVIAFLHIEPGNGGRTRSKVVVARASVESPREAGDFRFEDAAIEEDNPCSPSSCAAGEICLQASGVCAATVTGCTPADCGAGKACVTDAGKASCVARKSPLVSYPEVFGDFLSLAQGSAGLGMVVYDRPRGNLVSLREQGEGSWVRGIVDGETGSRADNTAVDTGDVGVAASLAIDSAGAWHVAYVAAREKTLRYVVVEGGQPRQPELVDDGSAVGGRRFLDGRHFVGDDAAIQVEGDRITLYYQDATVGTLRRAVGTRAGAAHTWELRAIAQPDRFGGFFPLVVPGERRVANFWEETDPATRARVGDVTILTTD